MSGRHVRSDEHEVFKLDADDGLHCGEVRIKRASSNGRLKNKTNDRGLPFEIIKSCVVTHENTQHNIIKIK